MNKNTFVIEASGTFLTEHLTNELLEGDERELYAFIEKVKWEPVEYYDAEMVFKMIQDLAESLQRFVTHHERTIVASWLSNHIDSDDVDLLGYSAGADIWYDAKDHNDLQAAATITATQNAMSSISSNLNAVMVGGDDE